MSEGVEALRRWHPQFSSIMQWNFWIRNGAQISTSPRRHARTALAINYDKSHVRGGLLALLRSTLRCIRAKLPPLSQLRRRLVSRISMLIVMGDLTSSVCAFHFPTRHALSWHTRTPDGGRMNDAAREK